MSVVEEGFICPYCLVGFATSGKLQSHFVEMHSGSESGWDGGGAGGEDVGATAGYEHLGEEEVTATGLHVRIVCVCVMYVHVVAEKY